jgi:hypothetical protein
LRTCLNRGKDEIQFNSDKDINDIDENPNKIDKNFSGLKIRGEKMKIDRNM